MVIRRILGQLKKPGLVEVQGTDLRRAPADTTLLDVCRAVEAACSAGAAVSNPRCPVGRTSQVVPDDTLAGA